MRHDCPPTLDSKDSEKLLDALRIDTHTHVKQRKAIRNHCMALIMLEAGLRVGELVSLRFSDLFFNSLPVRSIVIKPHMTKNKVHHTIPVSERLAETLRSYFSSWYLCDLNLPGSFAFFSTTEDKPLTTRQVERIINRAGWKALGRPVHPHVLRHTFASRLMRITNSSTVQQLLGHKFLSSTQVYCHPNEDDKRQAIESASAPSDPLPSAEQLQHPESQPAGPGRPGPQQTAGSQRPFQPPQAVPASQKS